MPMPQTIYTHPTQVLHVKAVILAHVAYWIRVHKGTEMSWVRVSDVVDSYHIFFGHAHVLTLVYTSVRTAYTSVCVVVPYARHSAPLAPSGHPVMVPESIFWPEHNIGHP